MMSERGVVRASWTCVSLVNTPVIYCHADTAKGNFIGNNIRMIDAFILKMQKNEKNVDFLPGYVYNIDKWWILCLV